MLVVVVFMSVTSVLICRRILPRFCSGEFFTFCYYSRLLEQHYYTHCRMASIIITLNSNIGARLT